MALFVSWDTLELREICENEFEAKQKLGMEIVSSFHTRYAELVAANSISDLPIGNPTPFIRNNSEFLSIEVEPDHEIVLECTQLKVPMKGERVDWPNVRRVKIVKIGKRENHERF